MRTLLIAWPARYPGRSRDNLRSPLPRAAVETFLDVLLPAVADLGRPAVAAVDDPLPILLKGVLHPDDARRALDAGVDGIVVSNHGGRQVDGAIAVAGRAARTSSTAVDGRVPVLLRQRHPQRRRRVHGAGAGRQRGRCSAGRTSTGWRWPASDGVRAGARAPDGRARPDMALTGITSVAEITRDLLAAT